MSGSFSLSDFLAAEAKLYGEAPRGLGRWDARVKLLLCLAAVLLNVLVLHMGLSAALAGLALLGLLISRVPWRQALLFVVAPLWATVMVVLGFGFGFGSTPLFHWGPLTFYREGLLQGAAAGLRVLAEMSWIAALVLTTPFTEILAALRWYRVPVVLVDLLASMYRYVFLLFDEYSAMKSAARARGGFATWRSGMGTLGLILAQVFMRALDRAERIDQAMRVRGRDSASTGSAQAFASLQGAPHA